MSSLSAKPGYNAALAQKDALKAQVDALLDQRDAAAREFGIGSQQAQQYQQQASALSPQYLAAIDRLQEIIASPSPDLASPTVNTGQSQSTPAPNARDDGPTQAPTSGGVGAGTTSSGTTSKRNDDNPGPSSNSTQQIINTAFANQRIVAQPNVLDQYASYTYSIGWYVLTPEQYNQMSAPGFNTGAWSLLVQSGGAATAKRNQFFPDDYYIDDLEIETFLMGHGTGMSTNGQEIRFKVVEPNGITLIQNLYRAVVAAYTKPTPAAGASATATGTTATANQTNQTPNYGAAQYCLIIEFYGYDSNGKLVAPATGQVSTEGQASNTSPRAVIKKYYPFIIQNLTFRTVANAVEYNIVANAIPYDTAGSQSRGTIPFAFALAGQTVSQLLQGGPAPAATSTADPGARKTTVAPNVDNAINAGVNIDASQAQVDANGNFTGETTNPFNAVGA
jgi:hypothetical protein